MERYEQRLNVLVLEDDSSISELLTWILTDAGYEVTTVDSLRDARRVCATTTPNLIIADLLLPDGLGTDLIYEISRTHNGSSPPSIIMSAVPQAQRHADAAGAKMCITKPFDLAELLDAIQELTNQQAPELQLN
jgi:DNA-binding response OmpR family regulator